MINITPINNFAYNRNLSQGASPAPQTPKAQSFGMKLEPDMKNISNVFKNARLKASQNLLIRSFLSSTLERDFDNTTVSNIFEEALIKYKQRNGEQYADFKITDFIPDFKDKVLKLKFHADEEGLKGSIGNMFYDGTAGGSIIEGNDWSDKACQNSEIFHDSIAALLRKFAGQMLANKDPIASKY